MDNLYYLFAILLFIAIVLFIEGAYSAWNSSKGPEASRIERRLRAMSAGAHGNDAEVSIVKQRLLSESPGLQAALLKLPRVHAVDRLLEQSGLTWNVSQLIGITVAAFLLVLIGTSFLALPLLLRLAASLGAAALPMLYVLHAKQKRLSRIEEQLPDALDLMGRALRAGHAFPTALQMVGDEMSEPLAGEFATAFDEVNFGVSMQDALVNLATRVPSIDLRYFVIAVLIQRETGGNLSELLGNISSIIRDRIKLLGHVRALSAEGKLSAWILGLLPFGAATLMHLVNPGFLSVLYTDPFGRKMIAGALVMMFFGVLAMRKIIRIRV
ncbi:type II secretion system F family protein [Noviherbaspirillum pedocola]|uniref:Type II secretion system F family protein n=1 Tax=Noviherbaspirillum pedocola TaxID=2801341 RepID=A0A934SRI5_9BURK|nr:type II secretion system F family protein [Noviherbaspirillum pedocola]MBK4733821.1 type II secretion system F family protein [Noviherbaspirillum pedocola]